MEKKNDTLIQIAHIVIQIAHIVIGIGIVAVIKKLTAHIQELIEKHAAHTQDLIEKHAAHTPELNEKHAAHDSPPCIGRNDTPTQDYEESDDDEQFLTKLGPKIFEIGLISHYDCYKELGKEVPEKTRQITNRYKELDTFDIGFKIWNKLSQTSRNQRHPLWLEQGHREWESKNKKTCD